jgi:predicted ribosomally synthesized peptide with SipW-like signal peptide
MDPWSSARIAAGAFATASLTTLLLRRFNRAALAGRGVEELRREFSSWQTRYQTARFAGVVMAVGMWWVALETIATAARSVPRTTAYSFLQHGLIWGLAAGLPGTMTAAVLVNAVFRRWLGERYPEFERYQRLLSGMDERRLWFLVPAAIALSAIGAYFVFDTYAYFTDTEIVTNKFWTLHEERHRYSDVAWIGTAPSVLELSGRRTRRTPVLIRFKDGSSWSTHSAPSGAEASVRAALARFVSERSSVPVTEVPFFRSTEL